MICRLTEIGTQGGVDITVEENYGNENLKETILSTDYDRSKTTGECGILKMFV